MEPGDEDPSASSPAGSVDLRRVAVEMVAPAAGLLYAWSVFREKNHRLVLTWLLTIWLVASLLRVRFGPSDLFVPDGVSIFLLLFVIPPLGITYVSCWLHGLVRGLRAGSGRIGWTGWALVAATGIFAVPTVALTTLAWGLDGPLGARGIMMVAIFWGIPAAVMLLTFLLRCIIRSALRRNVCLWLAALAPAVGLLGVPMLLRRRWVHGVFWLLAGWVLLSLIVFLEMEAVTGYYLARHFAAYFGTIAYLFAWLYGMAQAADLGRPGHNA